MDEYKTQRQINFIQQQRSLTSLSILICLKPRLSGIIYSNSITKLDLVLNAYYFYYNIKRNDILFSFPSLTSLKIIYSDTIIAGISTKRKFPNLKALHINSETYSELPQIILSMTPHLQEISWLVGYGIDPNTTPKLDFSGYTLKTFHVNGVPLSDDAYLLQLEAISNTQKYLVKLDEILKLSQDQLCFIIKSRRITIVCDHVKVIKIGKHSITVQPTPFKFNLLKVNIGTFVLKNNRGLFIIIFSK